MSPLWQSIRPEEALQSVPFFNPQPQQAAASDEEGQAEQVRALAEELAAVRREQSKLYRGLFEAAQVQRRLCAPRQTSSGEFEIAGEIFPVRYLSGDFFKVLDLGSALGVVVGDIAGKGLSAGIWLPYLISLIHRCAQIYSDPAVVVAQANRELCAGYGEPPLVALLFARINLADGEIVYCNAGLPSPLILGANSGVFSLAQGGPMLGAMSEASYDNGHARLEPGDMLVACSDGVTECQNSQDQEFRVDGLLTAARAASTSGGGTASLRLFSMLGAVLDFADGCSLSDDLTLLVVRRQANAGIHEHSGVRDSSVFIEEKLQAAAVHDSTQLDLIS